MGQMKNLVGKPDNKKNLLWQIDYLEGQLAKLSAESTTTTSKKDNKKPEINTRLWKTKIAVDRLAKHEKQLLRKKQNNNNSSDISQEEQSSGKETKQEREQKIKQQILQLKHQLLSQKIHHGQVQVQRCIKKYKTVELLKLRKMLKKLSSTNEEDKQQQEEKEKKIHQFEIKLATLKKFTIAHFSSLIVKTYAQLTYCLNTDLAATKKELAKIADDSNTVIFNHIDSLQKVLENFSTEEQEDDNENDKDDQKKNKYIFPDWFPVDQLVLTKEQVSDFKNVYPKENNNTNKDKEEDKCFKDYLKLITKLESVVTELKELRGVINYVAGVRNRDVKSSFQPTTDSTTDNSEEKKQENQQEKHKKKEKSSTENEQQKQEEEDNIEYHGRDIVLTDEENDSITDLENLKSSGKYLTGTKKLNYDDISESEEDDDYYNQITDDDDEQEEKEQKSSEDDDSDNEDEEFFENFSKKQDNKEEEDQKKKKKKVKKIVLPALLQGFVAPSNPQEAAELERELRDLEREEGIINNDNSDDDNEQKPNAPKIRKNRRGQRARREIYERKYGKHANHLKREFEKLQTERAIKQQQYEEREAKRQKKRKLESDNSTSSSTMSKGFKKNKVEDDNKPLHPSWEAKRKLKEQAAATQFKGKKIVFE